MFKKIIFYLPIYWLILIIFLLPLVFSFFVPINNVFELSKSVFFFFSLFVFTALSIAKFIYFGLPLVNKKYLSSIALTSFILLIFLLLSSVFISNDVEISLLGSYRRQQGMVFYCASFLFFILSLYNLLSLNKKNLLFIYKAISISGLLVAVFGLIQYLGLDPYVWQESLLADRIISSLGQPNNLGAFLLFSLAASFICLKDSKYIFTVIIYFQLLALYLSGSKSAWLGFTSALIIFLIIKLKEKINLKKFLVFIFTILIITLLAINTNFKNIFQDGSSLLRLSFYQASYQAFLDKPFFAYGLEGASQVLLQAYQVDWALYLQVNDYPDRVHNIILQTALNYGLVGFVIIIILYFFVFRLFYNNREKLNIYLLLAIFAYFIFLMFNFSSISSHVYFMLFLALLFNESLSSDNLVFKKFKFNKLFLYTISFLLFVLLVICYNYGVNKLRADRLFYKCRQSSNLDICFQAIEKSSSSISRNYYQDYTYRALIDNYLNYPPDLQAVVYANIEEHYNSIRYRANYLNFKLACFLDKKESEEIFINLQKQSPYRPLLYQAKADCLLRKGQFQEALDNYYQALSLTPQKYNKQTSQRFVSYLRFYQHRLYYGLAQSYFALNQYDLAAINYRLSFYHYPHLPSIWLSLIESLNLSDQKELAHQEIKWAQRYWPDDSFWLQYDIKK